MENLYGIFDCAVILHLNNYFISNKMNVYGIGYVSPPPLNDTCHSIPLLILRNCIIALHEVPDSTNLIIFVG